MNSFSVKIQDDNEEPKQASTKSFLWDLTKMVVLAFIIMIAFRILVAEPFIVSGSSMVPNFHDKEYLVVDKISYRFGNPSRGDVVIFRYPKDISQFFIKRIVGLPGEKIKIDNGKVVVFNNQFPNGQVVDEPYLAKQDITFGKDGIVSLGDNEYFVLGDNRLASSDSRVWGILPKNDIIGRAWLRALPIGEFGILSFPEPKL